MSVNLNQKEQQKYLVIKEYVDSNLSRKQAAIRLGVSTKTISVLKAGYLLSGKNYFSHKLKNRTPQNRIGLDVELAILKYYKANYSGFNFKHFYEYTIDSGLLFELTHGEYISARTVFRILERNNITSPQANKRRRKNNQHLTRPRRLSFGELVQLDASNHDWLSLGVSHKINLHLAIDDSTSQLIGGYFCRTETLSGYYIVFRQILTRYGIPRQFYTDKRSVFEYRAGIIKENEHIQFKAACASLGTSIIATSVAQAKGRVERSFRTHQDRLVSELKLAKITTLAGANEYLLGYMKRHNERYALKVDENSPSAFRSLSDSIDVNKVLSIITPRKILNGNVISFKGKQYYPISNNNKRLLLPLNTQIEIVETLDSRLLIKHGNDYYGTRYFASGRLTAHLPPPTHPWRNGR